MLNRIKKTSLIVLVILFLSISQVGKADEILSIKNFFVDPSYDLQGRDKIDAVLQRISSQLYFYVDENYWESLDIGRRREINLAIDDMVEEFQNNIYPILTETFGQEWKPGIDEDNRITVLLHPMKHGAGGYFNPADEYPSSQVAGRSNEREMVYIDVSEFDENNAPGLLAHEFVHLLTFNQKDRVYGVSEDTWLNEARAEYALTLLGYDDNYQGSNLQKRVKEFLNNPQDSLTGWRGESSDYGALNLFAQYLVDHYGVKILSDSLKSDKTGVASIDYALTKNGFSDDFSQIFTDWTVAIFVNDCKISPKYCYLNDSLENFRITPFIYYLPTTGESTLSVGYLTPEWAGNWQKIIGGKGSIRVEFAGNQKAVFKVPYVVEGAKGNKTVGFLTLDQSQKGIISVSDGEISSLTLIPSVQNKQSDSETSFQFSWIASSESSAGEDTELITQLQNRIKELESQVSSLLNQSISCGGASSTCQSISEDLYYGMTANAQVSCLQQFLKSQGSDIYPEGLTTGNFLSLTQLAVVRFQNKYASDILTPLGLTQGTGYVGRATRTKINQILAQ